jgi:hypothetical protein
MPRIDTDTVVGPQPTRADLDQVVRDLERGWTATLTVRRQSPEDIGYREIYVSLDDQSLGVLHNGRVISCDISPGPHELKVHNTLFRKSSTFTVGVGEHARFLAVNRAGRATYSALALVVGFLGAGPIYLSLTREDDETLRTNPPATPPQRR